LIDTGSTFGLNDGHVRPRGRATNSEIPSYFPDGRGHGWRRLCSACARRSTARAWRRAIRAHAAATKIPRKEVLSRARWNTFTILILRRASDGLDAPGASAARQEWQALCW